MRAAKFFIVLSFLLLFLVFTASAQRTRRPVPRATPRPTPAAVNPVVSVAKQQVSDQLYNVNIFVDKFGPIAIALENADKEANAGKLKKESIDANEANKRKMIAAIRGMRDGLVVLETNFRTKPQLAQYLPKLQGISTLSAQSEDRAIAGQFVASKDPLRQIALKLNDALAVMPGAVPGGVSAPPRQNRPVPISSSTPNETKTAPVSTPTQNRTISTPAQPASTTKSEPVLGMSPSEVLQTSWGKPIDKRVSGSPNGTTEVWLYSGNRSLYFFNGKLTNIIR